MLLLFLPTTDCCCCCRSSPSTTDCTFWNMLANAGMYILGMIEYSKSRSLQSSSITRVSSSMAGHRRRKERATDGINCKQTLIIVVLYDNNGIAGWILHGCEQTARVLKILLISTHRARESHVSRFQSDRPVPRRRCFDKSLSVEDAHYVLIHTYVLPILYAHNFIQ